MVTAEFRDQGAHSIAVFLLGMAVIVMLVGCSRAEQANLSESPTKIEEPVAEIVTVNAMEFIDTSGLKTTMPQVWIFDREGDFVSSEVGYEPSQSLYIERNLKGPGENAVNTLEQYLESKNVPIQKWRRCGSDYCLVWLEPAPSLGECEYCGTLKQKLDAYFTARGKQARRYAVQLEK